MFDFFAFYQNLIWSEKLILFAFYEANFLLADCCFVLHQINHSNQQIGLEKLGFFQLCQLESNFSTLTFL